MNRFPNERLNFIQLKTKQFKFPIPIAYARPSVEKKGTCVFIYVCGLGGTNSFNVYMNNEFFNNHYFVTYEKAKHGDNKNKSSQFKRKYLIELDCIVEWAKKTFKNKRIYLLGESWGCGINFLYYKKHPSKIAGVINWNMPTKVVDPAKRSVKAKLKTGLREIATFLFNIDMQLPPEKNNPSLLTRNKLLIRAISMQPETRNSTRLTLATWRYMKPSYHFLLNNSANPNYNFLYIQSAQDVLMCNKHIEKISAKADKQHFIMFSSGFHVLSMEEKESLQLYSEIQKFINK